MDKAPVAFAVEGGVDFLGDGMDLPAAGAGGQDEEVVQGGDASHVEDDHVAGLVVGRDAGAEAGAFEGGKELPLRRSSGDDAQRTSFRFCDPRGEVGQVGLRDAL